MSFDLQNAIRHQLIVVTGPESSGKSTLALEIASTLDISIVPEHARAYLTRRDGQYQLHDLVNIASHQLDDVSRVMPAGQLVVSDTFMLDIVVWATVKFGEVPEPVWELYSRYPPSLYLLCRPDIPWERDPLRENEMHRNVLFDEFVRQLEHDDTPVEVVEGASKQRLEIALKAVESFHRNSLH